MLGILLCSTRTPALQYLFRTHLRTAPQFLTIAPAPTLTLSTIIIIIIHNFVSLFSKRVYPFIALYKVEKMYLTWKFKKKKNLLDRLH